MADQVRIDKWLWAVRLFKTRSQATEACRNNRVEVDNQPVKPSREIHPGDVVHVRTPSLTRIIEVKELLNNRVGAKLVDQYMTDLTPPEEIETAKKIKSAHFEYRDRGSGRPTKKERRLIERLKKSKF